MKISDYGILVFAIILLGIVAMYTKQGDFIAPTLVALVAALKSFRNGKDIQEVHLVVNSRLSELLVQTAENAKLTERALNASKVYPKEITPGGSAIKKPSPAEQVESHLS
jgi:hypothetical protein